MGPAGDGRRLHPGETVRIHAPTGRDASLIRAVLAEAGHAVTVEPTLEALCEGLEYDCGLAIIAEEALTPKLAPCLLEALARQPSWADLPLLVLTSVLAMQYTEQPALRTLRRQGNVTLLERPVHPVTVLSAVQAGLRARRRQYEVRDYLLDRNRTEERIREAQKMEAVGQLAGGVAHEVNNMMTVVLGFGEFALRRLRKAADREGIPGLEGIRADLDEIVKAGRRAARITEQLLYLADAIVLLRYFEAAGAVRQAISMIKKRGGDHEQTIREFRIGQGGLRLGEPLESFQGVLTGVPDYVGRTERLLSADGDRVLGA